MINNPIPLLNSQIANGPIDVEIKKKHHGFEKGGV